MFADRYETPFYVSQRLQIPCIHNHQIFSKEYLYIRGPRKKILNSTRLFIPLIHIKNKKMKSWTDTSWIANYWIATLLTFHFLAVIVPKSLTHLEAVTQRCSEKKVFLEILQTLQKNASLSQVFSCELCQISKNIFFCRTPPVAASAHFLK